MKVFLSSTFSDLRQHRLVLLDTLMKMGTNIELIAMEYFGSDPTTPIQLSALKVSRSDIYIGVFGWRYGSIDRLSKMSITEIEYRTALAARLPVLLYLFSEDYAVKPNMIETGRGATKIRKLRKEISDNHTVQFFSTPEDLARRVAADLHRLIENSSGSTHADKIEIDKPVGPEINPAHPFLLCHLAKPSRIKDLYDVQIYFDVYEKNEAAYKRIIRGINTVVYQLHETAQPPVIAMQNWRENFRLEFRAWGEFWIRATVFPKDSSTPPITLLRYINLDLPWPLVSLGFLPKKNVKTN
jgi:hypothetical protein